MVLASSVGERGGGRGTERRGRRAAEGNAETLVCRADSGNKPDSCVMLARVLKGLQGNAHMLLPLWTGILVKQRGFQKRPIHRWRMSSTLICGVFIGEMKVLARTQAGEYVDTHGL